MKLCVPRKKARIWDLLYEEAIFRKILEEFALQICKSVVFHFFLLALYSFILCCMCVRTDLNLYKYIDCRPGSVPFSTLFLLFQVVRPLLYYYISLSKVVLWDQGGIKLVVVVKAITPWILRYIRSLPQWFVSSLLGFWSTDDRGSGRRRRCKRKSDDDTDADSPKSKVKIFSVS